MNDLLHHHLPNHPLLVHRPFRSIPYLPSLLDHFAHECQRAPHHFVQKRLHSPEVATQPEGQLITVPKVVALEEILTDLLSLWLVDYKTVEGVDGDLLDLLVVAGQSEQERLRPVLLEVGPRYEVQEFGTS